MKWALLLIALILGAIAGTGWLLDPGYVLVRISNVVLETSVAVAVLMFVVGAAVLVWLLQLLRRLLSSTTRFADWQRSKSARVENELQQRAVLAVFGGDLERSAELLAHENQTNRRDLDAQQQAFMHTVLAAYTAHARGDFAKRDNILLASDDAVAQVPSLGPMLIAQWYLESGEAKKAIAPLDSALATNKKSGRALSMLASVHIALEDWDAAEGAWRSLNKLAQPYHTGLRLDAYEFQQREDFHNPILTDAVMLAKLLARRASAAKEFEALATWQRRDIDLLVAWASELRVQRRAFEGADVLAAALDETWQPTLFTHWLDLVIVEPGNCVERALAWAKHRPADAHIQEALGVFASQTEQWKDARNYFETALKALPEKDLAKARIYRRLGLVWQALGDDHRALQYLLQAKP